MSNVRYEAGSRLERRVVGHLAEMGMAVMRAAGSKGAGKMDLVAFVPDGRVLIIQCKTDGKISPGEWNRLVEVAGWSPSAYTGSTPRWGTMVIPLVAMGYQAGVERLGASTAGRTRPPIFARLDAPKVPRSHTYPWTVYDVAHGLQGTRALAA